VLLPKSGGSWRHLFSNDEVPEVAGSLRLEDICLRISCGIATGADGVFVKNIEDLPEHLGPAITANIIQSQNIIGHADSLFGRVTAEMS
jgi:hypothetical protein